MRHALAQRRPGRWGPAAQCRRKDRAGAGLDARGADRQIDGRAREARVQDDQTPLGKPSRQPMRRQEAEGSGPLQRPPTTLPMHSQACNMACSSKPLLE